MLVVCPAAPSRTVPTLTLLLHNGEQWRALFLPPHPPCMRHEPPFDLRRVASRSPPGAAHALIPGPSSASLQPAADPCSANGHAHDGRFACLYYAALHLPGKVTEMVHRYTVTDLVRTHGVARAMNELKAIAATGARDLNGSEGRDEN